MDHLRSISGTRRLALIFGFAFALGLAIGQSGASVAIKTGSLSTEPGITACYTSGTAGDLVTDPGSGVAIIESNGHRRVVTWPLGWTGRSSGSEVAILDTRGDVHMRTGTKVYLMGGNWFKDDSFLTCGGRTYP